MPFAYISDAVPDYQALPTVDALFRRTEQLRQRRNPLVEIRAIGRSRDGEPIDLISIGTGSKDVLVVGTPHPNEPIGCLTIEFLIDRLLEDGALRSQLDYRWHFIKSIEPDGLRLNEGWLDRPLQVAPYFKHFFRPSLEEQAEYTFPLSTPNYAFVNSTPENRSWQRALQLVRPRLMAPLHNAEFGGAFYVMSDGDLSLARTLATQPARYGVVLNEIGELSGAMESVVPGVFTAFDIPSFVSETAGGKQWAAGESSFGHVRANGTFGLIVETPYWQPGPCQANHVEDIAERVIGSAAEVRQLLRKGIPLLSNLALPKELRFVSALVEQEQVLHRLEDTVRRRTRDESAPAFVTSTVATMMRMNLLRPIALLRRLSLLVAARSQIDSEVLSISCTASTNLKRALEDLAAAGMVSVPLRASVAIQVQAILTVAAHLNAE